ncbi:hypothetical protein ORV05_34315 [Amycolatopsis cynarae]|uniref:HNH endonuclease n=1 Tax=Amycolatopsis cynarae TaxID=2995223 RepID=A0ABY7B0Q3_9PSEU|nr:hypothetical protein [Amycolatopsis sp. HUAS 11-8]WAL65876.1 hypothetical protein ORV05_34315 [Amycolatopsis sp. HUAS 11-8]
MRKQLFAVCGSIVLVLAGGTAANASTFAATCGIVDGKADSSCTPGAFNPDVTQDTIDSTICVSGWTATVRPPSTYTTNLKNEQKPEYGEESIPNSELEEDHLVPLELGGAPKDPNNLWPEPRESAGTTDSGQAAENKDTEENSLKKEVCAGTITLDEARQQILADWTH